MRVKRRHNDAQTQLAARGGQCPGRHGFRLHRRCAAPAAYRGNADQAAEFAANSIPERGFRFVRHTSFTALSRQTQTPDGGEEDACPSLDAAETSVAGDAV